MVARILAAALAVCTAGAVQAGTVTVDFLGIVVESRIPLVAGEVSGSFTFDDAAAGEPGPSGATSYPTALTALTLIVPTSVPTTLTFAPAAGTAAFFLRNDCASTCNFNDFVTDSFQTSASDAQDNFVALNFNDREPASSPSPSMLTDETLAGLIDAIVEGRLLGANSERLVQFSSRTSLLGDDCDINISCSIQATVTALAIRPEPMPPAVPLPTSALLLLSGLGLAGAARAVGRSRRT